MWNFFLVSSILPKNKQKNSTMVPNCLCSLFGRIEDTKKTFRNYLIFIYTFPFHTLHISSDYVHWVYEFLEFLEFWNFARTCHNNGSLSYFMFFEIFESRSTTLLLLTSALHKPAKYMKKNTYIRILSKKREYIL